MLVEIEVRISLGPEGRRRRRVRILEVLLETLESKILIKNLFIVQNL